MDNKVYDLSIYNGESDVKSFTPRSLEAIKRQGFIPKDLVSVSLTQMKKNEGRGVPREILKMRWLHCQEARMDRILMCREERLNVIKQHQDGKIVYDIQDGCFRSQKYDQIKQNFECKTPLGAEMDSNIQVVDKAQLNQMNRRTKEISNKQAYEKQLADIQRQNEEKEEKERAREQKRTKELYSKQRERERQHKEKEEIKKKEEMEQKETQKQLQKKQYEEEQKQAKVEMKKEKIRKKELIQKEEEIRK